MASPLEFELPNAGAGPTPLSPGALDADFAVLLFHRHPRCRRCRSQAERVADRYDEFADRDAEVVSVLPTSESRATDWSEGRDLPYPVLADDGATVGDRFGQPVRFGLVGRLHDLLGRMPAAAVLDLRGPDPTLAYVHRGRSPSDRPTVDAVVEKLDEVAAMAPGDTEIPDADFRADAPRESTPAADTDPADDD